MIEFQTRFEYRSPPTQFILKAIFVIRSMPSCATALFALCSQQGHSPFGGEHVLVQLEMTPKADTMMFMSQSNLDEHV